MKGFIEVSLGYKTKNKILVSIDNIDSVIEHHDNKILHHDKEYVIETNSWIELKRPIGYDQKSLLVIENYEKIKQKIKEAQVE